jgi:hypothetical protein
MSKTVTIPIDVLRMLEPHVLGSFVVDFIEALPYLAAQRAHALLADALTDRGPTLPRGVSYLEELLSLGTAQPAPPTLQAELQGVADAAVEKAKGKRPASRAVASAEGDAPKPPRKRTSTAEVEELIRTAYGAGCRGVGPIAQSTGLGRSTVAAAVKRMQLEGVAG